MQSVARTRDENVLADVEASLRVAMQQTAITGAAEPLLYALRQADERLARFSEPQLERVRRAIQTDIGQGVTRPTLGGALQLGGDARGPAGGGHRLGVEAVGLGLVDACLFLV